MKSTPVDSDVSLSEMLAHARELRDGGERRSARRAYLALLMRDRYYSDAMVDLADLYLLEGDVNAARVIATEAAARHPALAAAHSVLGSALLEQDRLGEAHAAFIAALELQATNRKAWAGLGVIFERAGQFDAADHAWSAAFDGAGPAVSRYHGAGEPIRILFLWSAGEGNIPLKPVLEPRLHEWATLFVESFSERMILPPHDVVFNAVGNADLRTRALAMTQRACEATHAPVINDPSRVRRTGRMEVAECLRSIPGVVTPRMKTVSRDLLAGANAEAFLADAGFTWPLLVRALGYHSGEHFVYVADLAMLAPGIAALPGDELLVISYIDTRRADGTVRKYRVLSIDGLLYPLHLAISQEWKVHYFSADHQAEHRNEERAFLEDMRAALGQNAVRALEQIADALQLDYAGIDFTLDQAGNVVVFEANATMAIIPPGNGSHEAYRREPVGRAIEAVRAMIAQRARG
jgi:tetratricopeptide (TPR) repeat protein